MSGEPSPCVLTPVYSNPQMIRILGTVFAGLLGLAFGSFLNVCLSRWPEGESIVRPGSHCRNCDHTLAWWENIPLFSWLFLRGRCRNCHAWIGWRYPLVELAVATLWTYAVWSLPQGFLSPETPPTLRIIEANLAFGQMILDWLLVGLAVLDAEQLWLPDWITLPGAGFGFLFFILHVYLNSGRVLSFYGAEGLQQRLLVHLASQRFLAILAAAALILIIRWLYWLIRRREGIGLGDAKLMALLAAWLGLPGALLAFALGILLGSATALVLLALPKRPDSPSAWALKKLPLGTFLCIGGIVSSLWGQPLIAAYLRWSGF